jgi:hypothetical protein
VALLQEACPGTRICFALPAPGNQLRARAENLPPRGASALRLVRWTGNGAVGVGRLRSGFPPAGREWTASRNAALIEHDGCPDKRPERDRESYPIPPIKLCDRAVAFVVVVLGIALDRFVDGNRRRFRARERGRFAGFKLALSTGSAAIRRTQPRAHFSVSRPRPACVSPSPAAVKDGFLPLYTPTLPPSLPELCLPSAVL